MTPHRIIEFWTVRRVHVKMGTTAWQLLVFVPNAQISALLVAVPQHACRVMLQPIDNLFPEPAVVRLALWMLVPSIVSLAQHRCLAAPPVHRQQSVRDVTPQACSVWFPTTVPAMLATTTILHSIRLIWHVQVAFRAVWSVLLPHLVQLVFQTGPNKAPPVLAPSVVTFLELVVLHVKLAAPLVPVQQSAQHVT